MNLQIGDKIEHTRFGRGELVWMNKNNFPASDHVKVRFPTHSGKMTVDFKGADIYDLKEY